MPEILKLIRLHGPISVKNLTNYSGMEDKAVRNAIDKLRDDGFPICKSVNGFHYKSGFTPSNIPYDRWKEEP